MRFGEHFCAADFYRRGKCRGFFAENALEFCFGVVGFLVTGAQRAGEERRPGQLMLLPPLLIRRIGSMDGQEAVERAGASLGAGVWDRSPDNARPIVERPGRIAPIPRGGGALT
jgi:hypothetical protein